MQIAAVGYARRGRYLVKDIESRLVCCLLKVPKTAAQFWAQEKIVFSTNPLLIALESRQRILFVVQEDICFALLELEFNSPAPLVTKQKKCSSVCSAKLISLSFQGMPKGRQHFLFDQLLALSDKAQKSVAQFVARK